jgi:HrpA-like RNA helicase
MIREIQSEMYPDALCIDEAHEWNINIETLVAWGRTQKGFKLVIMSATMDCEALQKFYGEGVIIDIPGRSFPIVQREMKYSQIHLEVADLVKDGHNVLVFQPGKSEIYKTIDLLEGMNVQAQTLPLHGQLAAKEQLKVFEHYDLPKVVISTNLAQTSITIDDIDAVISSGIAKQIRTKDGIETLARVRISKAEQEQQMGRAGRCKDGIFIDAYTGSEVQPDFQEPEIFRISLAQIYLRLKVNDYDLRQLMFFHQPKRHDIDEAVDLLKVLGAIDEAGAVTSLGLEMSNLPISVRMAAFIIEGRKRKVLSDAIIIAAIFEVKGIVDRERSLASLSKERTSDLLAMLDLYKRGRGLNDERLQGIGLDPVRYSRAKEISGKLVERLTETAQRREEAIDLTSTGNNEDILKACLAGMIDRVYIRDLNKVRGLYGDEREIDKFSTIRYGSSKIVIGHPWNLQTAKKGGGINTWPKLSMCSEISGDILMEVAPHLFTVENPALQLDPKTAKIVVHQKVFYKEKMISSHKMPVTWQEVEKYLPEGETLESYREDFIRLRFEKEVKSGFLQTQEFDSDDERVDAHIDKFPYVDDPLTNEPIYAYPGVISVGKKILVSYYFSEAEAQQHSH